MMIMIDPNHTPCSIFMFVYRRYGPKYSPFAGATLYNAIPANGNCGIGGCIGKLLLCTKGGAGDDIPPTPGSAYAAIGGGNPGEAKGGTLE